MRTFIKNLMCLTHEQWLGRNLMKHHRTKDAIAIKIRGQPARELDRLLDKNMHKIAKKDRLMLSRSGPIR